MKEDALEKIKKVRKIQIVTKRMVNEILAGEYHSAFKGQGMEFDEVRQYQPGDDVRSIDWNVTARTGIPHLKRFCEERELTIFFIVDLSNSLRFGSGHYEGTTHLETKREKATEIAAVLASAATRNNDKVGMILFTDEVEKFFAPKKGKKAVLRVIREMLFYQAKGKRTNFAHALDFFHRVQKRKSIVFLISDFQDDSYQEIIKRTARMHDLIAIHIQDEREQQIPPVGIVEMQDLETGKTILVDTSSPDFQKALEEKHRQDYERQRLFQRHQIDEMTVVCGKSYIKDLHNLFQRRNLAR